MSLIAVAILVLGGIGMAGSALLYLASKRFEVYENPLIAQVQEVLPAAKAPTGFATLHHNPLFIFL